MERLAALQGLSRTFRSETAGWQARRSAGPSSVNRPNNGDNSSTTSFPTEKKNKHRSGPSGFVPKKASSTVRMGTRLIPSPCLGQFIGRTAHRTSFTVVLFFVINFWVLLTFSLRSARVVVQLEFLSRNAPQRINYSPFPKHTSCRLNSIGFVCGPPLCPEESLNLSHHSMMRQPDSNMGQWGKVGGPK